jgi:hypothetical protein
MLQNLFYIVDSDIERFVTFPYQQWFGELATICVQTFIACLV